MMRMCLQTGLTVMAGFVFDFADLFDKARCVLEKHGPGASKMIAAAGNPNGEGVAKSDVCEGTLMFYDAVMALPEAKRGPVLRAIYGE